MPSLNGHAWYMHDFPKKYNAGHNLELLFDSWQITTSAGRSLLYILHFQFTKHLMLWKYKQN